MNIFPIFAAISFLLGAYGFIALTFSMVKTNLVTELSDFSYKNPKKGYGWSDRVERWRVMNGLESEEIYSFFSLAHPINTLFLSRYSIIPKDEMGDEFLIFVKERRAMIKAKRPKVRR